MLNLEMLKKHKKKFKKHINYPRKPSKSSITVIRLQENKQKNVKSRSHVNVIVKKMVVVRGEESIVYEFNLYLFMFREFIRLR